MSIYNSFISMMKKKNASVALGRALYIVSSNVWIVNSVFIHNSATVSLIVKESSCATITPPNDFAVFVWNEL